VRWIDKCRHYSNKMAHILLIGNKLDFGCSAAVRNKAKLLSK